MKRQLLLVALLLVTGFFVWKVTSVQSKSEIFTYNEKVQMKNLNSIAIERALLQKWYLNGFKTSDLEVSLSSSHSANISLRGNAIIFNLGCDTKYFAPFGDISADGEARFTLNKVRSGPLKNCSSEEIKIEEQLLQIMGGNQFRAIFYNGDQQLEMHVPKQNSIFIFRQTLLNEDAIYQQLSN